MTREDLARSIRDVALLTGSFQLRSGNSATQYFDKYRFESAPRLLASIAEHLAPLIPPETDALAGLELGGVPIATALSLHTGLPVVFVRKEAKTYGTCQLAEGMPIAGKRLLIVEDVVTSGGQVVLSAIELRKLGAIVTDAVCVIDREAGGTEALQGVDISLGRLFRKSEVYWGIGISALPGL